MKIHTLFVFLFFVKFIFCQTKYIETTFWQNNQSVSHYLVSVKNYNTPSGIDDSTKYKIELKECGFNKYTCQILEFTSSIPEIYNVRTLKAFIINFSVSNQNTINILNNSDSIKNILKQDVVTKFGKDTTSFREYFSWLFNPLIFYDSHYLKYLNVMLDFLNKNISSLKTEIFVKNGSDSIPANYKRILIVKNDVVSIKSAVNTNSKRVKSFLYDKKIEQNGKAIKKYLKHKDMIYIPSIIESQTFGFKIQNSKKFIIEKISFYMKEEKKKFIEVNTAIEIQLVKQN